MIRIYEAADIYTLTSWTLQVCNGACVLQYSILLTNYHRTVSKLRIPLQHNPIIMETVIPLPLIQVNMVAHVYLGVILHLNLQS